MGKKFTDWDKYYDNPAKITGITRKFTENRILNLVRKYYKTENISIAELGGANSCFYDAIELNIKPKEYVVVDNNKKGLNLFDAKTKNISGSYSVECDLLNENLANKLNNKFDLVYSVGLIEHFDQQGTKKVIDEHFNVLKSSGIVLITFPTPTLLYRLARLFAEIIGIWIFDDERPIKIKEIKSYFQSKGKILYSKIHWKILLTQRIVVIKLK